MEKKKIGLIGVGKMGISHLSIAKAHPLADVVAIADPSTMIQQVVKQYTNMKVYADYQEMFRRQTLDAVIIAVPTKYHDQVVRDAIQYGLHVFVEKPFTLNLEKAADLLTLVEDKELINQVGYHNKFIATFNEAKRLIAANALGNINHFEGEILGPVIVKKREATWRSSSDQGGGCLMDYAAHLVDLIQYLVDDIAEVIGADLLSIYSEQVDDVVFAILKTKSNIHGTIRANWSDETYRKMHTGVTIQGNQGKLVVDSTELKVYFKQNPIIPGYEKGWNIKSINTLATPVDFYLRGEEYSLQLDYFIRSLQQRYQHPINTFASAYKTDQVLAKIKQFKIMQHGQNTIWGQSIFCRQSYI